MEAFLCFADYTKAYPSCRNSGLALRCMGPNAGIVWLWTANHSYRFGAAHLDGVAAAAVHCEAEVELDSGGH